MQPSALAEHGTTLVGLLLLGFFALLLCGGLAVLAGLAVVGYRSFQAREPQSRHAGWLAAGLLGALLAFLGVIGLCALALFALLSTATGAAGVARALRSEPAAAVPAPAPSAVEPAPVRIVAAVRGPLDPALVQSLTDIATRRRALDLRVTSEDDGATWIYEFTLPAIDPDPAALQEEMRRELEVRGHAPVSLSTGAR